MGWGIWGMSGLGRIKPITWEGPLSHAQQMGKWGKIFPRHAPSHTVVCPRNLIMPAPPVPEKQVTRFKTRVVGEGRRTNNRIQAWKKNKAVGWGRIELFTNMVLGICSNACPSVHQSSSMGWGSHPKSVRWAWGRRKNQQKQRNNRRVMGFFCPRLHPPPHRHNHRSHPTTTKEESSLGPTTEVTFRSNLLNNLVSSSEPKLCPGVACLSGRTLGQEG